MYSRAKRRAWTSFNAITWSKQSRLTSALAAKHRSLSDRLCAIKTLAKIGVILAGYVIAFLAAWTAVYIRQLHTPDAWVQASAGMYAFGDSLLFVAVFGFIALFPTGLALYFLRFSQTFWAIFSSACLALAVTGPIAAFVYVFASGRALPPSSTLPVFFSIMRILKSPLLAAAFLMSAFLAPVRLSKWLLLGAAAIECAVSAFVFVHFFAPYRLF